MYLLTPNFAKDFQKRSTRLLVIIPHSPVMSPEKIILGQRAQLVLSVEGLRFLWAALVTSRHGFSAVPSRLQIKILIRAIQASD